MLNVPTALLLHRTATGRHHDWLIGTPAYYADPSSGLWAARVLPDDRDWRGVRSFLLTPLPPHRRAYLTYQGPISRGRGSVMRVDQGSALIGIWTGERLELDVRMRGFQGRIRAWRLREDLWRAGVVF